MPTFDQAPAEPRPFTAGRYVIAWCNEHDARDPFLLTAQVKAMRDRFEKARHKPALVLLVVAAGEQDAAAEIIAAALDDTPRGGAPR